MAGLLTGTEAKNWWTRYNDNPGKDAQLIATPEQFFPIMDSYYFGEYKKAFTQKDACGSAADLSPPKSDFSEQDSLEALTGCSAENLYYGIGAAKDFAKARQCALKEEDSRVLTMVYPNGEGVLRNLDLAIHYACDAEGGPAELEGRVNHLLGMKAEKEPKHFDFCDDITSGMMQGQCAALQLQINRSEHDTSVANMASNWDEQTKSAFKILKGLSEEFDKLETDWIEASTEWGGTGAGARYEQQLTYLESEFQKQLLSVEKEGPTRSNETEFRETDSQLNKVYKEAMHREEPNFQTTTKESELRKGCLKKSELKWIQYRDSWVKFGLARFPNSKKEDWLNWLTKGRVKQIGAHQREVAEVNERSLPVDCTGNNVDTSPKVVLGSKSGKDSFLYPSWKEAGTTENGSSGQLPPGTLVGGGGGGGGEPNHPGKDGRGRLSSSRHA